MLLEATTTVSVSIIFYQKKCVIAEPPTEFELSLNMMDYRLLMNNNLLLLID